MIRLISFHLLLFSFFSLYSPVIAQNENWDQSVFIEGLGSGFIYSFNYEKKLTSISEKLLIRAGFGYTATEGVRLSTLPVTSSYLFGRNHNFLEVGAGFTLLRISETSNTNPVGSQLDRGNGILATFGLGYRRVSKSGFLLRAGITPLFGAGLSEIFWPQLSIGYAF